MRDADNIREIENSGADWMGFIFHPQSPRFVSEIPDYLPEKAKRVGVFVNQLMESIIKTATAFRLDMVQLHGSESPKFCKELRAIDQANRNSLLPIIKAFSIGNEFPSETVKSYEGACDYFLFDTKTPMHGGSGRKFNWNVLSDYRGETPFLLSGGISSDDAENILAFSHPKCIGIDINSRFEISPALKDVELIKQFIKQIKEPRLIDNRLLDK